MIKYICSTINLTHSYTEISRRLYWSFEIRKYCVDVLFTSERENFYHIINNSRVIARIIEPWYTWIWSEFLLPPVRFFSYARNLKSAVKIPKNINCATNITRTIIFQLIRKFWMKITNCNDFKICFSWTVFMFITYGLLQRKNMRKKWKNIKITNFICAIRSRSVWRFQTIHVTCGSLKLAQIKHVFYLYSATRDKFPNDQFSTRSSSSNLSIKWNWSS